jgi:hypothetical protein
VIGITVVNDAENANSQLLRSGDGTPDTFVIAERMKDAVELIPYLSVFL